MEVVDVILDIIKSVGFPIAVACYMFYVNKTQADRHAEESKEMTGAINELKIVIQKLVDKIEGA